MSKKSTQQTEQDDTELQDQVGVDESSTDGGADDAGDDAKDQEDEGSDDEGKSTEAANDDAPGEDDELVITIGDETPVEEDPTERTPLVTKLRQIDRQKTKELRAKDAEIAELRRQVQGGVKPVTAETLGEKPTLAACEYDEAVYEEKLSAWHETKRKIDDAKRQQEQAQQKEQERWAAKVTEHQQKAKALKVRDFDDVEAIVEEHLSPLQRAIIVDCAKDSAALQYALGKNPAKLKELAEIENPAQFTWAVSQLEPKLKITTRKAAPAPERQIRGSSPGAGGLGGELDKLRAEAEKTGDYTKVTAFKRKQAEAKRA